MTNQTIRTIHGALLSFDVTPNGRYVLNVLGGANERHIELTDSNMEELMDVIGKVYYGSVDEDSETWIKRLMKEAALEALKEKAEEDRLKELQQMPPQYPVYPYGPHGPAWPLYRGYQGPYS